MQLFADRARSSQVTFAVTQGNAPAVARVCQRLDGIPLALELAAARVKALPVEQLSERLDDMFRLLSGGSRMALPRQQTLRALIDWSYDLLTPSQRALLRLLSVFAGGWTLAAAEAVCAGEGVEEREVLDLLTSLVEKSLVLYEERGGEGRYRLLEMVRQYARDRLLAGTHEVGGEAEAVRERHRNWSLGLAQQAEPNLCFGAEEKAWMDRLEREHDNLRAALEWCQATEEGREAGLRLAGALTWFWIKRGHVAEGWQLMTRLLSVGSAASADARRKALVGAMCVGLFRRDFPAVAALAAEGLALGREAGDRWPTSVSLSDSALVALIGGELERAEALAEEALALARELEDRRLMAHPTVRLGFIASTRGHYERAKLLHQQALDLYRELKDTEGIANQLLTVGDLLRHEGNDEQARALWSEALALYRGVGDRSPTFMWGLHALADLSLVQGDPDTARRCYEEAMATARVLSEKPRMANALAGLARVEQLEGHHEQAGALLEEAQALDPRNADIPRHYGQLLLELGDDAAARSRFEEGLALRRARGDIGGTAWALAEAGYAAWLHGDVDVTQSYAVEAIGLFQGQSEKDGMLAALENLGMAGLAQGQKPRAARLLGAAEAQRETLSLKGPEWWRRPRERIGEAVRAAALEQEFAGTWAEGRSMSLEAAIQHALAENEPS